MFERITFLLSAIDEAAHDWYGKLKGMPLYELWGKDLKTCAQSCFTIGLGTIDNMVAKIKEEPDWPVYKIKLESNNAIETVTELRKHTKAILRVDANCSWSAEQTIEYSKALKELGVEFIEQPLAKDNLEPMVRVKAESALPIIADESVLVEEDIAKALPYFHGVNIKVEKCGGLTPARRMIKQARQLGLQVMVGCMVEGSVGISALAHLLPESASNPHSRVCRFRMKSGPELDYADLDGAALLKPETDNASGVSITPGGAIFPPGRAGTGCDLP